MQGSRNYNAFLFFVFQIFYALNFHFLVELSLLLRPLTWRNISLQSQIRTSIIKTVFIQLSVSHKLRDPCASSLLSGPPCNSQAHVRFSRAWSQWRRHPEDSAALLLQGHERQPNVQLQTGPSGTDGQCDISIPQERWAVCFQLLWWILLMLVFH